MPVMPVMQITSTRPKQESPGSNTVTLNPKEFPPESRGFNKAATTLLVTQRTAQCATSPDPARKLIKKSPGRSSDAAMHMDGSCIDPWQFSHVHSTPAISSRCSRHARPETIQACGTRLLLSTYTHEAIWNTPKKHLPSPTPGPNILRPGTQHIPTRVNGDHQKVY